MGTLVFIELSLLLGATFEQDVSERCDDTEPVRDSGRGRMTQITKQRHDCWIYTIKSDREDALHSITLSKRGIFGTKKNGSPSTGPQAAWRSHGKRRLLEKSMNNTGLNSSRW